LALAGCPAAEDFAADFLDVHGDLDETPIIGHTA
jgi:hypothetical protein